MFSDSRKEKSMSSNPLTASAQLSNLMVDEARNGKDYTWDLDSDPKHPRKFYFEDGWTGRARLSEPPWAFVDIEDLRPDEFYYSPRHNAPIMPHFGPASHLKMATFEEICKRMKEDGRDKDGKDIKKLSSKPG